MGIRDHSTGNPTKGGAEDPVCCAGALHLSAGDQERPSLARGSAGQCGIIISCNREVSKEASLLAKALEKRWLELAGKCARPAGMSHLLQWVALPSSVLSVCLPLRPPLRIWPLGVSLKGPEGPEGQEGRCLCSCRSRSSAGPTRFVSLQILLCLSPTSFLLGFELTPCRVEAGDSGLISGIIFSHTALRSVPHVPSKNHNVLISDRLGALS